MPEITILPVENQVDVDLSVKKSPGGQRLCRKNRYMSHGFRLNSRNLAHGR